MKSRSLVRSSGTISGKHTSRPDPFDPTRRGPVSHPRQRGAVLTRHERQLRDDQARFEHEQAELREQADVQRVVREALRGADARPAGLQWPLPPNRLGQVLDSVVRSARPTFRPLRAPRAFCVSTTKPRADRAVDPATRRSIAGHPDRYDFDDGRGAHSRGDQRGARAGRRAARARHCRCDDGPCDTARRDVRCHDAGDDSSNGRYTAGRMRRALRPPRPLRPIHTMSTPRCPVNPQQAPFSVGQRIVLEWIPRGCAAMAQIGGSRAAWAGRSGKRWPRHSCCRPAR